MRTIIAGSRDIVNYSILLKAIKEIDYEISTVICGKAKGVDTLGELYAKRNNIKIEYYQANWSIYGKSAGMIRNRHMAEAAESLLLIWDGVSKGSKSMLKLAREYNLKIHIHYIGE